MSEHDDEQFGTHDDDAAQENGYLTLDAIRNVDDTQYDDVPVPEWGGKVKIRSITKGEHQRARTASIKRGELNTDMLELNLLCAGMVEPKVTPEDAAILKRKNAGAIERLLGSIMRLSGLTQEAQDEVDRNFRD